MKASTLLFSLTSIFIVSACGDSASLGKEGTPVDTNTGSGGASGSNSTGSGGSISGSTGGSSSSSGGSTSTGAGGSSSGAGGASSGTGGSNGGTGGGPAGDGGADPCALTSCAKGTHCVLEQVACIQAPCPPQPTCVPDASAECTLATDCRLFDNYCGGCACDALPAKAADPKCDKGMVQCLVQPCRAKTAACLNGKCVAQ